MTFSSFRAGTDLLLLALTLAGMAAVLSTGGYTQFVIGLVALTTILGVGLNVLYGLTGLVSLGQVGFFAIGAYVAGIATLAGMSFWLALPLAGVVAGIAGLLLAVPAVRMAGPFLAMVTIAFAFIVEHGAVEWRSVTGGQNGLMGFPMPEFAGYMFSERDLVLFSTALAGVSLYLFRRLADSGWGMAMTGIRDAEIAATSLGYRPFAVKATAFAIAAAMAGLAGGLFTPLMMFIAPSNFPFSQSILFLFAILIGGAGTVLGPLAGALVTVLLPEFLSGLAEYRLLFFGGLLVGVLLLAPRGLVGTVSKFLPAAQRRIDPSRPDKVEAFLRSNAERGQLEIRSLGISFGGVRAVDGVSLAIKVGEVTSIIGPNGAGKTTVLNMISGFYRPSNGEILLGGKNLAGWSAQKVAREGVARTYQTTKLFENLTVVANVVSGLSRGSMGNPWSDIQSAENLSLAAGLLRYCGYEGELEKRAGDLPHVDRRLVEIARALALRPDILLLDEPAAGLMRADKDSLAGLLRKIADLGLAVVLVEHDMDLVMGISDRIQAVDAGKPIAYGTPAEIQSDKTVIEAYLGDGGSSARPREEALETEETPVLSTLNLTAGYGAAPVLKEVTMKVRPGEMVALLGANGAGKSTFLSALAGLHRPVDGRIILKDEAVQELMPHELVRRGLVLVPEGRQVFPELTVLENIELGAYKRKRDMTGDEIASHLDRFPRLKDRLTSRAGLLSGGEQQMMAIARGLMSKPDILLLDEPSLGLAPAMVDELYAILGELRDEGKTILLVDQMATMALSIADYAYVLEQGRIVVEGSAAELASDPRLTAAYLGGAETPEPALEAGA
ncbi:branched-chain amino acid ABC transporter ATP-binding protein/permease [Roseibium aggregatum]|uniref:ATP-binding cassette domain-containing protein n=1 Tax=Roseibium aggregatum TaxID=187304 RepID=A0A939EHF2_9HYPH|nr:branched-chain amino acid ABC transporter ATP-binding protein/permease [Roseibium aggregatum]MBN9672308.1 ATP-binding cassette domain-containing protein [Roseibium aggregatum]